ncbi:MAG: hypothetical protein ACYCPQ_09040 [Elusimicrobiota bacterium]
MIRHFPGILKKSSKIATALFGAIIFIFAATRLKPAWDSGSVNRGESLIYGLPSRSNASWSMPLSPVAQALIQRHIAKPIRASIYILLPALLILCVWQLANALIGPPAGVFASLLAILTVHSLGYEGFFLAFFLLLTACVLLSQAALDKPSSQILLGFTLGMSFLVKSPLFLFLPVLAVCETVFQRDFKSARGLMIASVVSFMILAPWIWMNQRLTGRFVPFENGRADTNVISGALGFIRTGEGDFRRYAALSPSQSAVLWAIKMVAKHPFRYAEAVFHRIILVFLMHPALFLLAMIFLRLGRNEDDWRRIGILIFYFSGIHCLLPMESRYITPLTPLLSIAAVCAGLRLLAGARASTPISPLVFWSSFIPAAALSALALILVSAYPARSENPFCISRALSASPGNDWVLRQAGFFDLESGDAQTAAEKFAAALKIRPAPETQNDYAWALLAQGQGNAAALAVPESDGAKTFLLKAIGAAQRSQTTAASVFYAKALRSWSRRNDFARDKSGMKTTALMSSTDARFCAVTLRDIVAPFGPRLQDLLLAKLSASKTDNFRACLTIALNSPPPDFFLPFTRIPLATRQIYKNAITAFMSGHKNKAEALLDLAIKDDPFYPEALLSRGALSADRDDLAAALSDYDRGLALPEENPEIRSALLTARAWALSQLGRTDEALKAATMAARIAPRSSPDYQDARSLIARISMGNSRARKNRR